MGRDVFGRMMYFQVHGELKERLQVHLSKYDTDGLRGGLPAPFCECLQNEHCGILG